MKQTQVPKSDKSCSPVAWVSLSLAKNAGTWYNLVKVFGTPGTSRFGPTLANAFLSLSMYSDSFPEIKERNQTTVDIFSQLKF